MFVSLFFRLILSFQEEFYFAEKFRGEYEVVERFTGAPEDGFVITAPVAMPFVDKDNVFTDT